MRLAIALPLLLLAGCASDVPGEQPEEAPAGAEAWRVHLAGPEAGEDHPGSVLLTRRAEAGRPDGFRPRLVLGCEEGVTQAYVEWGEPLGADTVAVALGLDGAPEEALTWTVSGDGEAAGLWSDSTSVPFIRALLGHDRLAIHLRLEGEEERAAAFTLSGLDSLSTQVQSLCPWA